jgi:hypothetical protein
LRPATPATIPDDELDALDDVDDIDPEDGKEILTTHELPELFCRGEEADDQPTLKRIATVFVQRKHPSTKELSYIDWKPIEQLSTVAELLEQFGPGTYRVQGRADDRKTVIKQIFHTIGDAEAEVLTMRGRGALERSAHQASQFDLTKIVAAVTAISTPLLGVIGTLMDRRDAARREEREREEKRQEMFMTTMSQLMNARNQDLEHLLKASQRPAAGGGSAEAYQEGQATALELLRAAKEEGLTGEDLETKMLSLLESLAVGAKKGETDAAGAAAAANGAASS